MEGCGTVWLVGMMGAGKSSVGEALARLLGRPFVDTDAEIEREAGRSIAEIFAAEGEAAFRALEAGKIAELAGRAAVVALGGGALERAGSAERLHAAGSIVYLRARPETLLARLGDCAERPLLRGLDPAARRSRLDELLRRREAAYASASLAVDTDRLSADEVAAEIAARLPRGARPGGR